MAEDGDRWSAAHRILGGKKLSVVLPTFRLAGDIRHNLGETMSVLDDSGIDYELVPVDDGSGDGTAEEIEKVRAAFPEGRIVPVLLAKNGGKGNALKEGFAASHGEYILLLDGDLDIAPKMLPGFFDVMEEKGADIVVGSKRHPKSRVQYPWHRRLASFVYFTWVRLFIGLPITDTQTGMKLFRREVLGDALARMLVKTYAFDLELLSIAHGRGAKIAEAPVEIRFGSKFGALTMRTVHEMSLDTLAVFYRLRLLNYYAKVEIPRAPEKPPFFSVVIACPKSSAMLTECLEALARQSYRHFEVIVLPDEAETITFPSADAQDLRLTVLPTGKVRPAEKRNLGINAAQGDVVAFIDDDAYPDSAWLENAVKYFGEPSIGAVGGPGVTPPGDGLLSQAGGRVYENIFVSGNFRYRYLGGRVRRDIDDYPSCNLLVRTDILKRIGGYRTDFWPGEDTLLCEAIVLGEHKRIVYDPWTIVYHHRRPLVGPHLRQLGRYAFHRGYFVKRFPATSCRFSYFMPTFFVLGVVLGGILAATLPSGAIGSWLRGTYFTCLGFYGIVTALSTFTWRPVLWILTLLGVWMTHLCYGIRFVQGLCSGRAPCEFIGKDHAGGGKVCPK